ncbi:cytochrome c oxidase subunit II [Halostella sp. PRR32]|uniref:cytochrome c oxidase subunit II n=1 Tax=Halostella sp. PRR32 TaxID=3098147 RepID=UPI002B1D56B5|nr:cytochrome c oxidase subunit II [Halostella sp. PRR32]
MGIDPPFGKGLVNVIVEHVLHSGGADDIRTTFDIFREIFLVFLVIGTAVGVVVVAYMTYNAYKYRDGNGTADSGDVSRPELGELPSGSGGGKKLFVSFFFSAIIVVSLIGWTYGVLGYYEEGPTEAETDEALEIEVTGYQFGWQFTYPNGHTNSTLVVPQDRPIRLTVTSDDVFHTFGVPEQRVKTDAIPGQTTKTWFVANETGQFEARCYELCGSGHSYMTADVVVVRQSEFHDWYDNRSAAENETQADDESNETGTDTEGRLAGGTSVTTPHHAIEPTPIEP